jgi:hypothetical protein
MTIYKSGYLIGAAIFIVVLFFFHNQIAVLVASVVAADIPTGTNIQPAELPARLHHVVIYAGAGIILFLLLRSLEIFISERKMAHTPIIEFCHLALRMLRWLAVFIFGDIVLQNLGGADMILKDYSMRYQAIGGLIAIEILVLRNFIVSYKKSRTNNSLQA